MGLRFASRARYRLELRVGRPCASDPRDRNSVAGDTGESVRDRYPCTPPRPGRHIDVPPGRMTGCYRAPIAGEDIDTRLAHSAAAEAGADRKLRSSERVAGLAQHDFEIGKTRADEVTLNVIGLVEDDVMDVL